MGQTDKLFCGFLRMMIARMKAWIEEQDPENTKAPFGGTIKDLQNTLEG